MDKNIKGEHNTKSRMSQLHNCFRNTEGCSLHFSFFPPEYPIKLLNQSVKIHTYNNIVFFFRWRLQDYLMNPLPFKSEKMKPRKGKSHNTTQYIKQKIPVPHDTALSSNTTEWVILWVYPSPRLPSKQYDDYSHQTGNLTGLVKNTSRTCLMVRT